jgi:flagellar motor switch protein FliN/FliY
LEVGNLALSTAELKKIAPGDFVVLDNCSLHCEEGKERVMLTVAGTPFFRARIKHGNLKILEHPLYYEVNTAMDNSTEENKENDEVSDFDLDKFDSELFTDAESGEIQNLSDSEAQSVEEVEKSDEDPANHEAEHAMNPIEEEAVRGSEKRDKRPKTLEEIPLPIVIEIGRIQMSIKQLLELQPGNMLDIDIHPESGVDLVVHGRKIAHGELLQIGDSLGVRILEIL